MSADNDSTPPGDGAGGPPRLRLRPPGLTMKQELQRRAQKATVGEVEDGLRNLMRLVKQQLGARDMLIRAQDGIIETLVSTIEELEAAIKEINPGWAGLDAAAAPADNAIAEVPVDVKCVKCGYVTADPLNCTMCSGHGAPVGDPDPSPMPPPDLRAIVAEPYEDPTPTEDPTP